MKKTFSFVLVLLLASLACQKQLASVAPASGKAPQMSALAQVDIPNAAPTPAVSAQVTATTLHIRTGATYHSKATDAYLHKGQTIVILACDSGWAKIAENQWVRAFYLNRGCRQ